ncbi:hypothetical protein ES754_02495 [Psychrobacter frigidicola]|uniref:Uncharacterized protein n=1 Tax=Psychrobacter frigidicola TaxID=45611 RepID=A0A5C7AAJ5_9GAMM|nr:hypothetical protein [Psychrobacter frigidicola]TXD97853.1 hypothetical protein ES754_02495 [Psychrobacter frigidicola]
MKKTILNSSLRTVIFTAFAVTVIGVSACSSEKEEPSAEAGEVIGVDQSTEATALDGETGSEIEGVGSDGMAPTAASEANLAAEADYRATTGEVTEADDMSETTDSGAMNEPDSDTTENPNAGKTAANGLQ